MAKDGYKAMTIRVNSLQWLALHAIAQVDEIPVVEVVREAIDAHIAKRKADPEFQLKLKALMAEQKHVYDMLLDREATDAAKFAEREYERVCEERDSVTESYERMKHARTVALQERNAERPKLARVREALDSLLTAMESTPEPGKDEVVDKEWVRHSIISDLRKLSAILNDSDSTEVDNA